MNKKFFLRKKLKSFVPGKYSVSNALKRMGETGFQGRKLAEAADVFERMIRDKNNTIFLGYAGSMSTTGQWKIVKWLVENRFVDVIVSTGANISEDILEASGGAYYKGTHVIDDAELLECAIDRFYDVYADDLEYTKRIGWLISDFLETLDQRYKYSSAEFLHEFGRFQLKKGIRSITAEAFKQNVPIFSPAMADSEYGCSAAILQRKKGVDVTVSQFKDFYQLGAIGERAKNTSVFYVGGGVPKDTIQLVTVIQELLSGYPKVRKLAPHKYAIQVTCDSPQWGGLSGCTFEEAVSWGKIDKKADKAVCYCDATIALPLISSAINERIKGKRKHAPDLSWVFEDIPR